MGSENRILTDSPSRLKTTPLKLLAEYEGEEIRALSREQFEELRKSLRGTSKIIVELLFYTGARITEFLSLKGKAISLEEYRGYEWFVFDIRTLKKRTRPIRKIPVLKEELSIETIRFLLKKLGKNEYLFPSSWSNRKKPATRQWAWHVLKRINEGLYPHIFRHSRLTDLAQVMNILELHFFAGWSLKSLNKNLEHYIFLQWTQTAEKLLFKKQVTGYA
ncbi:MAG: tyrosine-type recombinase/integrase [Candidatus Asgardarchaeia archaeon]